MAGCRWGSAAQVSAADEPPAVIILGPIFYPIAAQMGVSTLHFSIIIVACVGIGLFLPPVGVGLFIACGIAHTTVTRVMGTFRTLPSGPPGRTSPDRFHPLDYPCAARAAAGGEITIDHHLPSRGQLMRS